MKKYLHYNGWLLLLAFLIPSALMVLAFLANGIYWGGPVTVLAGDAYHQYVAIATLYSNILHSGGRDGFFYTWTSGLGLNLYAFASYYMGSFFMPLTYFFNVKNMPDALYLFTILKFGFIGLSSFVSFSNMYKKVNHWLVLALSISFSLLSFLTSQNEIPMWQDVFILVPLILWGLQCLQMEGKRTLYFVSLTILFIQNYYFGFILAIFVSLYFLAQATRQRWSWRALIDFVIISALSAATSLIMLLPMYLDLKANGQAFSSVNQLFTAHSWGLDFFAKNMVGSYDTTQYNAVPMIYVGLFPLLLACCFFFIRGIRWGVKIAYGLLLTFIIASFYFSWLDLAWQGFHAPNMFLHRYAWVLSVLVVLMALETLAHFEKLKLRWIFILSVTLSAGFLATVLVNYYKSYINWTLFSLTVLFLAAYVILLVGYKKHWLHPALFISILLLFVSVEAGVNSYYQIAGVKTEWNYPSRSYYDQMLAQTKPAADKVRQLSAGQLVRTDNTTPDTANDSMKYNFYSIAQFSSVRNSNSSAVMADLGFQTDGDYLNLRYPGNTLLMDSIFNVKYNINATQPSKFGFDSIPDAPSNLSANSYALPLGIFVPGGYHDVPLTAGDTISNQTAFVNALTGQNQNYFTQIYGRQEAANGQVTNYGGSVTMTRAAGVRQDLYVRYSLAIPAHSQAYIQVPNIVYDTTSEQTTVTTPFNTYGVSTNDAGSFFNLGYYSAATTLTVTLTFPQNSVISFDETKFYAMNTDTYAEAMAKVRENPVSATTQKNGAKLSVDATKSGQLFLTIPYDKGWSATVNGKSVSLQRAQSGFMKVNVPAGKSTVVLHFFPQGLSAGIVTFISGILLFIFYQLIMKNRNKKKQP